MKSDQTRVRGLSRQIVMSIALSALLAALAEFFLLFNLIRISDHYVERGHRGILIGYGAAPYLWMLLFVFLGLLVFTVSFFLLERKTIAYILDVSRGMERLASGDLTVSVPVEGDNEISVMAEDLNTLAVSMKELIERERESEEQKSELITNVAHDLRTPLTSISGYLRLLESENISEEDRRRYLTITRNKTQRLETLIENLFDFTKLSVEKIKMDPQELDLISLLQQLLDEFYPAFEDHGMTYELSAEEPQLLLTADGNLLARLFDNLVGNAIKYGASGKRVEVFASRRGSFAHVEVKNYGRVIPKEKLPYVFDKLYRAEESRGQQIEGNGLGLAIVKSIAEMHGGSVGVTSGLEGTVFFVDLPLKYRAGAAPFVRSDA